MTDEERRARLESAKRRIREAIDDLDTLHAELAEAHLLEAFAAIRRQELGMKR